MVNFLWILIASFTMLVACSDDDDEGEKGLEKAAPTVEWPENPDFEAVEILSDMTGKVAILVKAEAGIKDFKLDIVSDVLTNEALGQIGLSVKMDLVNDANVAEILGTFKIPVGNDLKDATEVNFDVSGLIPMILALSPEHSGNHVFTVDVTDNQGKQVRKALTFHYTHPSSFTVTAIDLWKNTAVIAAEYLPEGAKVQYRLLNEEEWQETVLNEDGTFEIQAQWTQEVNEAGKTVFNVNTKTGVFAGHVYQLRAVKGEEVVGTGDFETEAGDVIPNGEMNEWSEKTVGSKKVAYPNAEGTSFWDSGNNGTTPSLCTVGTVDENSCAQLVAKNAFNIMMASGNLFTGDFTMATMTTGKASFGRSYAYSARPSALKVRCQVKVGVVDYPKKNAPKIAVGQQDTSRIMVCIVDWNAQHGVTSGLGTPTGMWDPVTMDGLSEDEKVIGYGSLEIGKSTDGEQLIEVLIPINYYDKEVGIPTGDFTLVIACSTSKYGDYGNGCSSNTMKVDDFQWVY